MNSEAIDSVDANPSDALTSQIASSILQERYGVRGTDAAPHKVQDAVRRCLQDVSATVQSDHPQWDLPRYPTRTVRSRTMRSRSSSPRSELRPQRRGVRAAEEDENPFLYDGLGGPRERGQNDADHKRTRGEDDSQGYPCPFRRRNPILFNVRDHETCAKRPFSSILDLKYVFVEQNEQKIMEIDLSVRRHIRVYHRIRRQPHCCPRCKKGFASDVDLSNHLTVPLEDMCEPLLAAWDHPCEDVITEEVDQILADGTSTNKIQSWEEIWRLLFPQDTSILDPGQSKKKESRYDNMGKHIS